MTNPLTIAAAHAAGPIPDGRESQWLAQVKDIAVNLAIADQDIDRKVALLNKISLGSNPQNGGTKGWGIVRGTLRQVEVEARTRRGLLTYEAYDRKSDSMQSESIRTNFVSDPDAAAMVEKAQGLIGHEVDLYKYQENKTDGSGETVKILAHLVDRGIKPAGAQRPAQQQAQQQQAQQAPQGQQQPAQQQVPRQQVPQQAPQQQVPQQQAPQQVQEQPVQPVQQQTQHAQAQQQFQQDGGERIYPVNEAKSVVFEAAQQNPQLAAEAWAYIGNPAQPLRQQVLARAVQFVQNKLGNVA